MTLNQLEYIVAVDKFRHFVRAAESCNVTQSTLSSMVHKLENELDVIIFDRNSHPVEPTKIGEKIISQAKVLLYNAEQLKELVLSELNQDEGNVKIGIIPTVAPYILPKLFKEIRKSNPQLSIEVTEAMTENLLRKLRQADLDMIIASTPLEQEDLLEIPIYYEKFLAYICPGEPLFKENPVEAADIPSSHLWVLKEGHCLRNQVLNICNQKSAFSSAYEAGSIDTLVRIVDDNGGYTIIPELHVNFLNEKQRQNVRKIVNPEPVREVSIVIRQDFVKERILNIISDSLKKIIPEEMIDSRLKKFAIKL